MSIGDVEAGFAEADVIVEGEFGTTMVHQGYIEPHASTAKWNEDGELIVWTSTQGAFGIRASMSLILDLPVSQIKVIPDRDRRRLRGEAQALPQSRWPRCSRARPGTR